MKRKKNREFIVLVKRLYIQPITIKAKSEQEAIKLVANRKGKVSYEEEMFYSDMFYSHELSSKEWNCCLKVEDTCTE